MFWIEFWNTFSRVRDRPQHRGGKQGRGCQEVKQGRLQSGDARGDGRTPKQGKADKFDGNLIPPPLSGWVVVWCVPSVGVVV